MKIISIFRHAQAEAGTQGDDCARALTPKGLSQAHEQAKVLAQHLSERGVKNEIIVASKALRTQQTAQCFHDNEVTGGKLTLHDALYASTVNHWLLEIASLPDSVQQVTLIGHNPEISALAQHLSGRYLGFAPADGLSLSWDCEHWADTQHTPPAAYTAFPCQPR